MQLFSMLEVWRLRVSRFYTEQEKLLARFYLPLEDAGVVSRADQLQFVPQNKKQPDSSFCKTLKPTGPRQPTRPLRICCCTGCTPPQGRRPDATTTPGALHVVQPHRQAACVATAEQQQSYQRTLVVLMERVMMGRD